MATTTTNYGWDIPQSTDLVKDGATAIALLGQDIDTSMNTALAGKKAGMVLLNTTSFSAVASQSVSDVFSSTYDNYRIVYTATNASSATIRLRLRASGSDISSANYNTNTSSQYTDNQHNQEASQTSYKITYFASAARRDMVMDLISPNLSAQTFIMGIGTEPLNASMELAGTFTGTDQATGFTIFPSAGNFTGTVSVYGYNK